MAVITISRTLGSLGDEIALRLSKQLDYQLFDKQRIVQVAKDTGVTGKEIEDLSEDTYQTRGILDRLFSRASLLPYMGVWSEEIAEMYALEYEALNEEDVLAFVQEAVRRAYQAGNMIIVGRASQVLLRDYAGVLHVRLDAPEDIRVRRVIEQLRQVDARQDLGDRARSLIQERDTASAEYIKRFYHVDWTDPQLYHMVLNTGWIPLDQVVRLIATEVAALPEAAPSPPSG